MQDKVKILAICGSLRPQSYTRMALNEALKGAQAAGADIKLLDLRDYDLGFCGVYINDKKEYGDNVHRLRAEVKSAHGLIWGTPEYHGSFSGVLKNALDLMGFEEFEGKMIGLIGVSAGSLGGNYAINSLRAVGRSLHAWVVPDQVSIPNVYNVFDETGQIVDKDFQGKLQNLGRQVARFSYLHSSKHAQEFIREWEAAPQNPVSEYQT